VSEMLKNIIIVGGGTSGWMAAACFSKTLKPLGISITLVESSEIGTVGVGEATIPPLLDFIRLLGIDERHFIQSTQATFKLGIQFNNWCENNHSYWHQFGTVGANIDGVAFYQHWLRSKKAGNIAEFTDYAPSIAMAKHNKFDIVADNSHPFLQGAKYALHFDATLVATYLRNYSEANGVVRVDSKVERAQLSEQGNVASILLEDGRELAADFFIDCSGFGGLIIEGALKTGYEDWSSYLPCDRAVVAQTVNVGKPVPYTQANALTCGWQWQIPLQHRTGNGYVFSSAYCSDAEAIAMFEKNVVGELVTAPRVLHFITGKRNKLWNKNCLAVGLASGFLEPLESTSIHLAMKAILKFVELLPSLAIEPAIADEFNRILDSEYKSVRDFIILHYCTTRREDTPFWRWCGAMEIPATLQEKINLFKSSGRLQRDEFNLFSSNSWYAVLEGMKVRPDGCDPLVYLSNVEEVNGMMAKALKGMEQTLALVPSHDKFIEKNCPAF
jgi:tryptophan 7-halogenase